MTASEVRILTQMAWRNIWRNPRRTAVLVTAIGVGVFSFIGSVMFMDGFTYQMVDAAIDLQGGHIQIAAAGYQENPALDRVIDDLAPVEAALAELGLTAAAPVLSSAGMANSAEQAAGVVIHGVDPAREPAVTLIAAARHAGAYLSAEGGDGEVFIGAALADRLNLAVGEKLILLVNDATNDLSAGAFRIVGLYRTGSTAFDRTNVYLTLPAARTLLGFTDEASTVALRLPREADLAATTAALARRLGPDGLEVLSWEDRNKMLVLAQKAYDYSVVVLVVILFTAVGFTLINAFLMVILERIREIGIMMANGVRPKQIRRMLYLEAGFLTLLGAAAGIALAALVFGYWYVNGLDLSGFAEGLDMMGVRPVVYPHLDWPHMGLGFSLILVMVWLSVLYPAFRASRFETVAAINHV